MQVNRKSSLLFNAKFQNKQYLDKILDNKNININFYKYKNKFQNTYLKYHQ